MKQIRSFFNFNRMLLKHVNLLFFLAALGILCSPLSGQDGKSYAVLNFDTQGINLDPKSFGSMVRIELEKIKDLKVMDKYEMTEILQQKGLDVSNCYGKSCLLEVGRALKVDRIISGSAEVLGNKLILTIRMVDMSVGDIVKSDVTEYINRQDLFDRMITVSVNNLFGIQNNQTIVDQLTRFEEPIAPVTSYYKLNGPRIGLAYITGDMGETIKRPKNKGGFDGYPVLSQIGYQYEVQYLGAGNFLALLEFLAVFSGMEQQMFIPTFVFTNGFRLNNQGWEIAFGPTISLRKTAQGFYDTDGLMGGASSEWYLVEEWSEVNPTITNPYEDEFVDRMDSRGDVKLSTGWIWAIGKTFHSGFLNIPLNVYIAPRTEGWYIGLSVGFNVSQRTK